MVDTTTISLNYIISPYMKKVDNTSVVYYLLLIFLFKFGTL